VQSRYGGSRFFLTFASLRLGGGPHKGWAEALTKRETGVHMGAGLLVAFYQDLLEIIQQTQVAMIASVLLSFLSHMILDAIPSSRPSLSLQVCTRMN